MKLEATPEVVAEGPGAGTTAVSWWTSDPGARVTVSVEGGREELFGRGAEGSTTADWIWPGTRYEFRLYGAGDAVSRQSVMVRKRFGHGVSSGDTASALERDGHDDERLRLFLAATLTSTSNCIDIGGNEGLVLALMVQLAPNGRHLCFEPLPHMHQDLTERFPNVDVRRTALSNLAGTREFVHVRTHPGYSGFRERSYPAEQDLERIQVRVERLDDTLPRGYVPSLVKIDVEGAEMEVLEGAVATIAKYRPAVIFEHGRGAADHYGTRPEAVFDLLCRQCGLTVFDLDGNGPYSLGEFVDTFETGTRWNYVARFW